MGVEHGNNRGKFRVSVVSDIDELRRHSRIDVHLRMAHVSNKFHTHHFHFIMDQITRPVARISSKNNLCSRTRFNFVHHFQRLHLQSFGDLKCDKPVVVFLNTLDEFFQLKIVSVQIHQITSSRRTTLPSTISSRTMDEISMCGYFSCN